MEAVASPAFKMYWQPNQYKSVEDNIASARLLREHVVNVHVFNWSGKEKYPLADAAEIWKKYLAELGGYKTLLLEFMPDGSIDSLKREAEALRVIAEA